MWQLIYGSIVNKIFVFYQSKIANAMRMDLLVAVEVAHAYARRNMVEANVKKVG